MRNALMIYDVSGLVYCGARAEKYKGLQSYGFPVGGIHYLMKHIVSDIQSGKDVALTFDSKSFRKEIDKTYKAGRPKDNAVYAQLDLLFELLQQCGIVCYKKERFEADDLIFNIVENNKGEYDYGRVEILGVDYDLTHNIVSPQISFHSVSSQVNCVTWYDFSTAMVPNKVIPINTISAYKIWCGDKSDNIKPFCSEKSGITGEVFYSKFLELIRLQKNPLSVEQMRSRQLLEVFLTKVASYLDDKDMRELKKRMDLVFPVKLEGDFKTVTKFDKVDLGALVNFLSLVNDRTSLRTLKKYAIKPTDALIQTIKSRSKALVTGEYAVDKNRSVLDNCVNTELVNLKGFD